MIHTILSLVAAGGIVTLGIMAERYRLQRNELIEYVKYQHRWIDEIIKALEDPDEDAADESIDSLLDRVGQWGRGVSAMSGRWGRDSVRDRD